MSDCEIECIIDDEKYIIRYNMIEVGEDFMPNILDVWDAENNLIDLNYDGLFYAKCEQVAQDHWDTYIDEYYEEY